MNSRDPSVELPGSTARAMPDVQGSADHRRQPIHRVGVRGLRYPMLWRAGAAATPTVAVWGLFVALPADQKGTHMSRFVALLERRGRELSLEALRPLHAEMLDLLQADAGRFELAFPLFVSKAAPVSGVNPVIRGWITMLEGVMNVPPGTETTSGPVIAASGTMAVRLVFDRTSTVAFAPPIRSSNSAAFRVLKL